MMEQAGKEIADHLKNRHPKPLEGDDSSGGDFWGDHSSGGDFRGDDSSGGDFCSYWHRIKMVW